MSASAEKVTADINKKTFELCKAARDNNKKRILELISEGLDINTSYKEGFTALHYACQKATEDTIQFLVRLGGNLDKPANNGRTPRSYLAENLKIAFEAPQVMQPGKTKLDVEQSKKKEESDTKRMEIPVHERKAINDLARNDKTGNEFKRMVDTFISNHGQEGKNYALLAAAIGGHLSVLCNVLKQGADVNYISDLGWTVLMSASFNGHKAIVEYLLANFQNINITFDGNDLFGSALGAAVYKRDIDIVKLLLLKNSSNINTPGTSMFGSPMTIAIKNQYSDILEVLRKATKANTEIEARDTLVRSVTTEKVNADSQTNLKISQEKENEDFERAALNGHIQTVRTLVANGVHQRYGNVALVLACQEGHADIVKILLDAGVNPRIIMKNGMDALFVACHNGHAPIVNLLLSTCKEFSEWINQRSYLDRTPLRAACAQGHLAVVQLLLNAGADITITTVKEIATPLHVACDTKRLEIVSLLLDHKNAKEIINAKNCSGFTPLMSVADIDAQSLSVQMQMARMLLSKGADVNSVSHTGATALMVACSHGNLPLTELLYENRASLIIQAIDGTTALSAARAQGHAHIVKFLLSKGILEGVAAEKAREDSKQRSESARATLAATGEKLAQEFRDVPPHYRAAVKIGHEVTAAMVGVSWKTRAEENSVTFPDRRHFEGALYTTEATKGKIALIMTNAGNAEPGELRVGVRFPDRHILTLAKLYKTRGHDFWLRSATGSECVDPPSINYGVFRTPQANYNSNPAFGYVGRAVRLNCSDDDTWVENREALERTHSPEPPR